MVIAWSLLVVALTAAQPAAAPAATAQPAAVALPAALEQEARQIERMLIAPCCWMQPVSDHQSQASDEVKQQIREWLGTGMTRQQVLDAFVARYGARILAEPPNRGVGRFLYLTPWLVFGVSAIGLVVLVKKITGTQPAPPAPKAEHAPPAADAASQAYEERLDDELRDMD